MLWVAAAGPAANLVMAIGWALLMKIAQMLPQGMFSLPMMLMAEAGITVNIVLMVLNACPSCPGRRAHRGEPAPEPPRDRLRALEPFGFPILLALHLHSPARPRRDHDAMVAGFDRLIEAIFQL